MLDPARTPSVAPTMHNQGPWRSWMTLTSAKILTYKLVGNQGLFIGRFPNATYVYVADVFLKARHPQPREKRRQRAVLPPRDFSRRYICVCSTRPVRFGACQRFWGHSGSAVAGSCNQGAGCAAAMQYVARPSTSIRIQRLSPFPPPGCASVDDRCLLLTWSGKRPSVRTILRD